MSITATDHEEQEALREWGESLRILRERLMKCSQSELARRLGISRSTVVRMEQGDPRIPVGFWMRAWRRLYQDPVNGITVLQVIRDATHPKAAIARQQMLEAATRCALLDPHLSGDAVEDARLSHQRALGWMAAYRAQHPSPPVAPDERSAFEDESDPSSTEPQP